eukprot:TRINITY_DN8963_c0_g3_i9.p1 TRINITY_DN8963_c0_g3~~TRINITY_DN8963_c0_g3_i9.p1  ORF type:complete len:282 (-),score=79.89 TRINITY_DN8963_c0_g3_i9:135-980(-)
MRFMRSRSTHKYKKRNYGSSGINAEYGAGGLENLAKMPSSNLFILGRHKQALSGFSTTTAITHHGVIGECDIVKNTPSVLEVRACRLIAGKCTLAARLDSAHSSSLHGETGRKFREEIVKKLEKLQEPPPARKEKPLPVPDEIPRKRRGGQRMRKHKERYALTEIHKRAMRVPFGANPTEEYGNTMKSLGMLGMEGSGTIRANVRDEKGMKIKKRLNKKMKGTQTAVTGLGFATSVYAMTPMQGLELPGPERLKMDQMTSGTTSYFSQTTGFTTFVKKEGL